MLLNVSERLWIFTAKENYSEVYFSIVLLAMLLLKSYFEANFPVEV